MPAPKKPEDVNDGSGGAEERFMRGVKKALNEPPSLTKL
jgi:hypothetical protein